MEVTSKLVLVRIYHKNKSLKGDSASTKQPGCNVSLVRRLALDARGRRFESYHPDQIMDEIFAQAFRDKGSQSPRNGDSTDHTNSQWQ